MIRLSCASCLTGNYHQNAPTAAVYECIACGHTVTPGDLVTEAGEAIVLIDGFLTIVELDHQDDEDDEDDDL
ncbi:hypothetical protein [Streptomyces alboflavus]|uniref:hypothetical protein n=1 Tax=Streptomyces alboflavus TaxID=67267 RepID=UPI00369674DE